MNEALQEARDRIEAAQTALSNLTRRARETPFDDPALHPDDNIRLEQVLHELVSDLDFVLGQGNNYSQQLVHIFNSERAALAGVASVKCVQRMGAIVASAMTRIGSRPPQTQEQPDRTRPIRRACERLHGFVRQLERSGLVQAPLIHDERSLQHLLGALLRLYVDDVRPEEYSPSYAGGGSRIDFLLKDEQVAVEAKIAHPGNPDKDVGAQLLVDQERYRAHPHCRTLLCLVYDADEVIRNPHGLKNDLERLSDSALRIVVVISPTR